MVAGLTLVVWDVQHGSSAVVETPSGKHFVFDLGTGSFEEGGKFSPLTELRRTFGVSQVDLAVISHPHADHIADIWNWDQVSPRALVHPVHLTEQDLLVPGADVDLVRKYFETIRGYGRTLEVWEDPRLPQYNGGVTVQHFLPQACPRSNLNNHSVVTVLEYQRVKILIPGDNESPSWNELLQRQDFLRAIAGTTILIASHHGRESGYSPGLMSMIKPLFTVVSDGPSTPTSAVAKYTAASIGWDVISRTTGTVQHGRKCLTTRTDGWLRVKVTPNIFSPTTSVTVEVA